MEGNQMPNISGTISGDLISQASDPGGQMADINHLEQFLELETAFSYSQKLSYLFPKSLLASFSISHCL